MPVDLDIGKIDLFLASHITAALKDITVHARYTDCATYKYLSVVKNSERTFTDYVRIREIVGKRYLIYMTVDIYLHDMILCETIEIAILVAREIIAITV